MNQLKFRARRVVNMLVYQRYINALGNIIALQISKQCKFEVCPKFQV